MSGITCVDGRTKHKSTATQANCRKCRAAMGNGRKQAAKSAPPTSATPLRSAIPSGVILENKKGGLIKLGANQRPDSVGGEIVNSSGADLLVDDTYLEEGAITHAEESSRNSEIRGSEIVRSKLRVSDGADVAYSYLTDVDVTVNGGGIYDSTLEGNSGEEKVALSKSTVESTLINDSVSFSKVEVSNKYPCFMHYHVLLLTHG